MYPFLVVGIGGESEVVVWSEGGIGGESEVVHYINAVWL